MGCLSIVKDKRDDSWVVCIFYTSVIYIHTTTTLVVEVVGLHCCMHNMHSMDTMSS